MNKIISKRPFHFLFIYVFLFIFFACGKADALDNLSIPSHIPANDLYGITTYVDIRWAYNPADFKDINFYGVSNTVKQLESGIGSIFDYINQRYNVTVTGGLVSPGVNEAGFDIFRANPYLTYNAGLTRAIPRDMIERYAPDYAGALSVYNSWEPYSVSDGELWGLNLFNADFNHLDCYSLYRLDWLEREGISYHGDLTELREGVYFTPEAFSQAEYAHIMYEFSRTDAINTIDPANGWALPLDGRTWGLGVNYDGVAASIAPILGMHGVNRTVLEEDGKAIPYYASDSFKSALRFLYDLTADGCVMAYSHSNDAEATQMRVFSETGGRIGWASMRLSYIFKACETLLSREPDARVLITPPEIGANGQRGTGAAGAEFAFTPETAWVVRATVTDEKLARILQIFNDLSFDTETYTAAAFGIAGEDFQWEGEPYASAISQTTLQRTEAWRKGRGLLITDIVSDPIKKLESYGGFPYLYNYAESPDALDMHKDPFRSEIWGGKTKEKIILDSEYQDGINAVLAEYLPHVLSPNNVPDFDLFWNDFQNALQTNGLAEYINFYN